MAHPRKLIRAAIVAVLQAANTTAGQRVYKSRSTPWRNIELPAISVWSTEELVDEGSEESSPRELVRGADFNVDLVLAMPADGDVDDALDDFAEQVEDALKADRYLRAAGEEGTASDSFLVSSTFGEVAEGNKPMGALRLVYRTRYITEDSATAGAAALQTAGVTHNLSGGQHPDNQAQDLVTGLDE